MPTGHKTNVLTGDRYGRLIIMSELINSKPRRFLCKCDCGREKILRLHDLRSGAIKSCGCLLSETSKQKAYRHGGCPDGESSRLYIIWNNMKLRCLNQSRQDYRHYGGRGITICEEWLDFKTFQVWALENGYRDDLTLDREDNNGNYEFGNCRWVTQKTQCNNIRNNILLEHNGQTRTLKQWAEFLGMKYTTLYQRYMKGWSIEKILMIQLQK